MNNYKIPVSAITDSASRLGKIGITRIIEEEAEKASKEVHRRVLELATDISIGIESRIDSASYREEISVVLAINQKEKK